MPLPFRLLRLGRSLCASALALVALAAAVAAPGHALAAPSAGGPAATWSAQTDHFRIFAAEGGEASAQRIAAFVDSRWRALCAQLGACGADRALGPVELWVAPDPEAFADHFPHGHPMAEWAAGVTFVRHRRIVLRAHGSQLFALEEVLDHELSHVLVHAIAGERQVPRWFLEGVAIWQAGESVVGRLEQAHHAALTGSLAPLSSMIRAFPSRGPAVGRAYAQSALFVRWLVTQHGEHRLTRLFERLAGGATFNQAFANAFLHAVEPLEAEWRAGLERGSSAIVLLRDGTVLWVGMGFLFVVASLVSIRRRRRRLEAMADAEEAEVAWAQLEAERELGPGPMLH